MKPERNESPGKIIGTGDKEKVSISVILFFFFSEQARESHTYILINQ
jgi:hypothetical protein